MVLWRGPSTSVGSLFKHPWVAPALVAGYFVLSIGLLYLLNVGVPMWLEQLISAFAAPAVMSIVLWNPVLRPLGLTTGEWFTAPSLLASLSIVAFYTLLAFALGMLAKHLRRK